ncbi:MAG TPA: hypothetical protein VD970_20355 [Acetobacteraceae bacterium]|nr:hypothetical protein [Acetobacteraceae bacterium]
MNPRPWIARGMPWPACGLVLALAGCGASSWGPSWNMSSRAGVPGDSLTVQRVLGQDPAVEPLRSQQARWLVEERPRATLGNPDQALQGVPAYAPVPRPDVDRSLRPEDRPPPRRRSSAYDPNALPRVEPLETPPPARAARPRLPPPPSRVEGAVVPIPGAPGVVTGGTDRYQTFQQPGTAGGGVVIPQGNGTGLVIGPDGRTITVPLPR